MIIQVDSREQKFDHVTRYFDSQGIKWVKSKCVVGDYVNLENPMVVIDRKKDLQEVAGNVCQQHERFVRELELAKELGYKMIILVEDPNITALPKVCSWYNWRSKKNPKAVSGKTLYKIMSTCFRIGQEIQGSAVRIFTLSDSLFLDMIGNLVNI